MGDFQAPQFCIGFDGEEVPVVWGDCDTLARPVATKVIKGKGTLRAATEAEQSRYGVLKRFVGSRWYKSSHTACVYPKLPKGYRLEDTFKAIRAEQTRELGRPSTYNLFGDGERTAEAIKNRSNVRDHETLQARIREARYLDWLEARDTAAAPVAAPVVPLRRKSRAERLKQAA